jgi:hypothetical protein
MRFRKWLAEWLVIIAVVGATLAVGVWLGASELGANFYDRFWWAVFVSYLIDLVITFWVILPRTRKALWLWWLRVLKVYVSMAGMAGLCFYVTATSRGKLLVIETWQGWSEWIGPVLLFLIAFGSAAAVAAWKTGSTERRRKRLIEAAQKPLPSTEPDRSLLAKGGLIE